MALTARRDLPCDAFAHFRKSGYVIIVAEQLGLSARKWIVNHLLGLVDVGADELTVRIPTGEVHRMMGGVS